MWPVTDSVMWSLGKFKPTLPDHESIQEEVQFAEIFELWLNERVETGPVGKRSPWDWRSIAYDLEYGADDLSDVVWHQDGLEKRDDYLVVWSNTVGTEICNLKRERIIYQGAPGEVIMFDNAHFRHRRPPITNLTQAKRRWFARATVRRTQMISDVPGVYRYIT